LSPPFWIKDVQTPWAVGENKNDGRWRAFPSFKNDVGLFGRGWSGRSCIVLQRQLLGAFLGEYFLRLGVFWVLPDYSGGTLPPLNELQRFSRRRTRPRAGAAIRDASVRPFPEVSSRRWNLPPPSQLLFFFARRSCLPQ